MGPNTVVSTRPRSWGLSMVCYHWGSRSPETACVSTPASRLGGDFPDSGRTIGDEKQRPVPQRSYHASGAPFPNVAENNNSMTIRRTYNKAIYFFEMSVLFETGELNAYVYDSGGLYRRKYVRTESKGRQRRSLSRTESFSCA